MSTQLNNFLNVLNEVFQFNQEELDFGIYRIMNKKREEVAGFLNEELVPQVKKSFEKYKSADAETVKQEIRILERQLADMGVPKENSQKYQDLSKQVNEGINLTALENEVYSDLANFFKRYYHEGDFMSMRRYKKNVYAIPYEGEEVKLHWANADQYYVKTTEQFRDYSFDLPSAKKVHFKLIEAETEQNNNKAQEGKERRFILAEKDTLTEENGELIIKFEYKVDSQNRKREKVNEDTIIKILSNTEFVDWVEELKSLVPTEKNKDRTLLKKHLDFYTAKNTFDYFIHKDLGGFLTRELDFYIKNEIMHLDDLDTQSEKNFEQYISKVKVIKSIGNKIIQFLSQIENFQKKLWLKKKFVVETNYCLTLDKVPTELYQEICDNAAQIEEWKVLYAIEELEGSDNVSIEFIERNPHLIIDTKNFNKEFLEKLLSGIKNIDEEIDGILVNSDNFQALNLLENKHGKNIKGVYIDPPYNSDATEIVYKNGYKNSSWLSLMNDRLITMKKFMTEDAVACVTIDDYEVSNLSKLMEQVLFEYQIRPTIIEYNHRGRAKSNFAITHEYALWAIKDGKDEITRKKEISEDIRRNLRRTGTDSTRESSPGLFYGIEVDKETLAIVATTDPLGVSDPIPVHTNPDTVMIWPIDDQGIHRRWYYGQKRVLNESKEGTVWAKVIKKQIQIHYHQDGKPKLRKSVWVGNKLDASTYGTELINDMFGMGKNGFSFPKSIHAVKECLEAMTYEKNAWFLDFFAGSGTTGHAVIDMNREDNGKRKYILVEMGEYFNTVTKPRVKKAIHSKDWSNGKPISRDGLSHMLKYVRLESYEDTLNNIVLNRTKPQQLALEDAMSETAREEYYLSYMLDVESKESASLLNIKEFKNPFEYKMNISNGTETKLQNIDVIETFNYLLGLQVEHIQFSQDAQVITGKLKTGEKALVIWRNLIKINNDMLDEIFMQKGYHTPETEFDYIFVNGDNHLENLKAKENNWKVYLIEEEFRRLMFDVQDV